MQPQVKLVTFESSSTAAQDERTRLATLRAYEILDTLPDPRFDVFVRVAAQFYDVPISLITLVDEHRVWFKSALGLDAAEAPREIAFCAQAIEDPATVLVIEDLASDSRYAQNPLVTGEPDVRFYAGAPIVTPGGQALGTLCILDRKARTLDIAGRQRLADLAIGVGCVLDLHRCAVLARRAASHDPLTGLANRSLFDPALHEAAHTAWEGEGCAVLCIDLDGFKSINDRLGHAAGDSVLNAVSHTLLASVRETDLVARLGGDEFGILLRAPLDPGGPALVAERLITALSAPLMVADQSLSISASIGYAGAPSAGSDGPTLLRAADAALYRAKAAGRCVAVGADQPAGPTPVQMSGLAEDLRTALRTHGLTLNWQACVNLDIGQSGGHEALLRWNRPGHGPVAPDIFIAAGEAAGLAWAIDSWVLENACAQAAAWPVPETVSINITPSSFCARDLTPLVRDVLARTGLAPDRLILEITERMAMDRPDLARTRIDELHRLGVKVALDDFGSGFSALGSLEEFDFDRVKLDRSFIRNIGHNIGHSTKSEAIARAVIELGREIGFIICAEGVETVEQLAFLQRYLCPMAQGYLFGRPGPEPVFDPAIACMAPALV